jgi:outer membrane protein assembly factor BamB
MRPLGDTDPQIIATYRLLGVLGSGGMGRVYLGESRSGRRVAIKVVRTELAADPGWRRRFIREVAAVRAVSPLFTAAVVDADTNAPEPWLATTFIDGPSLASRVNQAGPLSPGAVLVLAAGLAEALASIHKSGLVHRDLKPSNVIINDDGPQIIDFGIALTAETPATTSMLLGTPSYIAPERIHGSEADPASDIFSLGATLVFAATGRPLVTEGPVYAQLMQITTGRFDLSPVPPDLRPLIVRCVSHQAKDRPTAEELSRILGAARVPRPTPGWYAASGGVTAFPVVPGPPRFTRRRLLVAGGVVGAVAVAVGVAELLPPTPPTPRAYGAEPATPSPTPTPKPPVPGEVVWQLASGAKPVAQSPGNPSAGQFIVVDAEHIVSTDGSNLFMVRPTGERQWRNALPTGLVSLRRWGDGILVNDSRRVWLFDLESGNQTFVLDMVGAEETAVAGDNADNLVVQIGDIALSGSRAFVNLATSTVAIDRSGDPKWRMPRPARRGNEVRPAAGGPAAANDDWVLTHNVIGTDLVQSALRRASDGEVAWNIQYPAGMVKETTVPNAPPPGAGPPPTNGGAGGANPPAVADEDWSRAEGRLAGPYAVLREGREVHVLDLDSGDVRWNRTSQTPVVTVEVFDDLVLVAADRLTAYAISNGAVRFQTEHRGARIGGTLDGQLVIVACTTDGVVTALDHDGAPKWRTDIPAEFANAPVEQVFVDAHTVYVTFKARGQAQSDPGTDVLAIALDDQAKRYD